MLNTFKTRPQAVVDERHRTGPDALTFRLASDYQHQRDWRPGYSNVSVGHKHDEELYKVRTKPHLYEDWHVRMVEDLRAVYVADCTAVLGEAVEDWNCHHCKTVVLTREGDACPHCDRR